MQTFYASLNWTVTVLLLGLGLAALLKNHRLIINRLFSLFSVAVGVWIISSYTSNDIHISPETSVIGNYIVFLFSYISSYLLAWFSINLTGDVKSGRLLRRFSVPILVIGAITPTPLVVANAHRQADVYAVDFGPLVILYFLTLLSLLTMSMIVLRKNIKYARGDQKAHIVVFFWSLVIALPILLATEFVLPAATGWFGLTNVGIVFMAIPTFGLYYGVVKFKLFNLRIIIVRSLAYAVTLSVILLFYGLVSYYATTLLNNIKKPFVGNVLNVALIILVAVSYVPLKRNFDKLTNRLFYRDAYDPQEFLDQLNRSLVTNIDLKTLLDTSAKIIADNLKAEYCSFGIKESGFKDLRFFGTSKKEFATSNIAKALHTLPRGTNVLIADYLSVEDNKPKEILLSANIQVLVRLVPEFANKKGGAEGLGYLVLGQKRSGNAYTSQDVKMLEILANELVITIQNALHFEEIQRFNITLQDKVDDATRKLRKTNQRLEELDETKDDFISMASHQLRTPLTSIKGYLSMVLEGDAGKINDTQNKMLAQAFTSSQRMVFLITDLLNVSRLKTGKFVIESSPTDLSAMVDEELSQLTETARSRNLSLIYHKPSHFPLLMLDNTKIRQVIMNFVDNAIYYTPSGGTIRIELTDNPQTVELRVIDNGIGVPRSEQHHLFTKFYRAPNAQKARPDGTGLGLFMARKVIIAQGGTLLFSSKEGEGSTFGFAFSKSRIAVPSTEPPASKQSVTASTVSKKSPSKSLTPVK